MKKALFFLSLIIFSFGCKKDDGSGGTNGTGLNTYLPLTNGTSYTYKSTNTGVVSTLKLTIQPGTFTLYGKSYKRVLDETKTDTSHYNQTGNDYFRVFKFGGILGEAELTLLKDNLAVGGTWSNSKVISGITIPSSPFPISATINFNFSIDGKDLTRVVNGKTYSTVIKVKLAITATTLLGTQNVGDGEFYFAKNIGMIEYNINTSNPLGGGGASADKLEMIAYDIK